MSARASESISEEETAVASLQQLGNGLRQARESRGINVEEVAARLRLSAHVVRDIEAGAFEHLPAATYARGYLRAYANFIGINPEPLLAAYDQYADKPPEINPYASSPQPQVRATDLSMRMVTYAIAAVILGSAGIWLWQTQKLSTIESLSVPKWGDESTVPVTPAVPSVRPVPHEEGAAAINASVASSTTGTATPNASVEPVSSLAVSGTASTSSTVSAASSPQTVDAQPSTTPASNDSSAAVPAPVSASTATTATTSSPTSTPTTSVVDAKIAASGMQAVPAQGEIPYATTPANSTVSTADANAAPGQHVLTFECAEDSWLEVYDSENKRLYYSIAKQGSRVSVQGLLPYHVKVGNSPAVLVNYEGHPLDMTAFTQGSVARFQVTPDGYLAQP